MAASPSALSSTTPGIPNDHRLVPLITSPSPGGEQPLRGFFREESARGVGIRARSGTGGRGRGGHGSLAPLCSQRRPLRPALHIFLCDLLFPLCPLCRSGPLAHDAAPREEEEEPRKKGSGEEPSHGNDARRRRSRQPRGPRVKGTVAGTGGRGRGGTAPSPLSVRSDGRFGRRCTSSSVISSSLLASSVSKRAPRPRPGYFVSGFLTPVGRGFSSKKSILSSGR